MTISMNWSVYLTRSITKRRRSIVLKEEKNKVPEITEIERELLNALKRSVIDLKALIESKKQSIQDAPKGELRIDNRQTYNHYYWKTKDGTEKGEYIPSEKRELAYRLAQRNYDEKILKIADKELILTTKILKFLEEHSMENVYSSMHPARQKLVKPVSLPDAQYIECWRNESYEPLVFRDDAPEYYSGQGVRVRSKSELLIANALEQNGVYYRYEYPIRFISGKLVRPDFLCLNLRTRKEYIWEHFGMMDNISYANENVNKIEAYGLNGYHAGINMIMTFESSQTPINTNIIKQVIQRYLQ